MPDELRKEYAIFMAHINKVTGGNTPVCPICKEADWILDGPHSIVTADSSNQIRLGQQAVAPEAKIVCRRCHFQYQFAWLPIEKAAQGNG